MLAKKQKRSAAFFHFLSLSLSLSLSVSRYSFFSFLFARVPILLKKSSASVRLRCHLHHPRGGTGHWLPFLKMDKGSAKVAPAALMLEALVWNPCEVFPNRTFIFFCDCLSTIMVRSVNCLDPIYTRNAVQVRLIGAKPIVQVRRWNRQVGPLRRSLI